LAAALAANGEVAEAEEIVSELTSLSLRSYVNPALLALTSIAAGRRDEAIQWLERAYQERDPALSIYFSRVWWPVEFYDNPRFRELRDRAGLK